MAEIEVENIKYTSDNVREANENFYKFLEKHKVEGDGVEYTHTSFGPPFGKYFIDDTMDYEKFLILYKRLLETEVLQHGGLYITEKQKKVGPLFVDYDFRFDDKTRQYSSKNIKDITAVYMNLILKYIDIKDSDELKAYVTEKAKPTHDEKQQNYKDGFHVIFPIPIDVSIRFLIHDEAAEYIKNSDILVGIPYINDINEVIDDSVVMRNGWLMYGSKKWKKSHYILTKVYDMDMNEYDRSKYSKDELAVLFSAQRYDEDEPLELKEEFLTSNMKNHIKTIYDKYNGSKKQKNNIMKQEMINNYIQPLINNNIQPLANNPDVQIAKKILKILSDKRADKYSDWAPVGWTLHSIDAGLLDDFIEFSKKCPQKFSEEGCRKFWYSIKSSGYTIASLHYWAKQDSYEEYNTILMDSINKVVENAETGNHDDLAKVLYELYKYEFRCVSKTKNKWYGYENNRWHLIDGAYKFANKISDELAAMFAKRAIYYMGKVTLVQGGDKDNYAKKTQCLMKIIEKLKTESFKNAVISSSANRFFDCKFEEKIDSNRDLLGFENGVYDLKAGIFRKGIPEDYIILSTGYDYNPNFTINSKEIIEINNYYSQVMVDNNMREYLLLSFASFLDGHIKEEIFRILTGEGGNAKSQTMELLKLTMGQYFGKLPTSILTRKRGGSSSATPELADKRGKRFLVIDEPEHDDIMYVGQMKQFTGGDIIPARALYGDPFEYMPQFKLGCLCNKMPQLPAVMDGGTMRRLAAVPFESTFVNKIDPKFKGRQFLKDRNLKEKIKEWGQAHIWLLLNVYYKKYKNNNYVIEAPEKVTQFTDKYRIDSDKYHEFLSEYIVETSDQNDMVSLVSIYSTFKNWHSEAGYGRNVPTRNEFKNYIASNKKYDFECGNYMGICYKDDWEEKEKNNSKTKNNKTNNIKNNKNDKNKDSSEDEESKQSSKNDSDDDMDKFNSDED